MERGGSNTRPWFDVDGGDDDDDWQRPTGFRRAWAITRWGALVFMCGMGAAAAVGILIGVFYTVVLGL